MMMLIVVLPNMMTDGFLSVGPVSKLYRVVVIIRHMLLSVIVLNR